MNNWIAASNACTFISPSKPMGGECHNCPHFPFSAAGFNGYTMLDVMRQAQSVAYTKVIEINCCSSERNYHFTLLMWPLEIATSVGWSIAPLVCKSNTHSDIIHID